jgi:hypothetical protein
MAICSLGQSARRWAGAILALLACGWLAPASDRAEGCDFRDHRGALDAHFDRLAVAGALAPMPGLDASTPVDPPMPCSGAFCSGKPAVPSMPASPAPARAPQWACQAELPPLPSSEPLFDSSRDGDARPVRRPPSIFHPPRAS